jgi:hypothetical protein
MAIYAFHKRERQFKQAMSSSYGPGRGRYFRLTALSAIEILGTIPLGTYFIVRDAKAGVTPWKGWADTHSHYSAIPQVAGFIWKNDPQTVHDLELFRWLLVACAFIFFAFFGFGDEARQNYRRVYTSLAIRIGYLTFNHRGSSHGYVVHLLCLSVQTHWVSLFFCSTSSIPHMKSKGGVTVPVFTVDGNKLRSVVSLTYRPSIPSTSIAIDNEPHFKSERNSPSNTVASFSVEGFDEPRTKGQSTGGDHAHDSSCICFASFP